MRGSRRSGRDQAHLVTEARPPRSAEIRERERRYLLIMGIRVICFIAAGILFVNHAGWLTIIPAAGAIALPYFAVVVANARRSGAVGEFRGYQPRLPDRYSPPPTALPADESGPDADDTGDQGRDRP